MINATLRTNDENDGVSVRLSCLPQIGAHFDYYGGCTTRREAAPVRHYRVAQIIFEVVSNDSISRSIREHCGLGGGPDIRTIPQNSNIIVLESRE